MFTNHPFRTLLIFAITPLLCFQASAADKRLHGFWVRTTEGVAGKRWNLSANGTGTHESDFGPPYPGFVLTSYFTWTTNAANTMFTYKVTRQTATGNGPYNYDEVVSPAKTYSEPYTLTGTTHKIWAYEDYTYAQAASLTDGNTVGPGTLDTTFNKTGIVPFIQHAGTDGGREGMVVAGAIQPGDGKILVVSNHSDANGYYRSYLTRYDIGGTLDRTFNQTGTRVIEFGRQYEEAKGMAVDPRNGLAVVAGTSYKGGSSSYPIIEATLSRHTTTGAFDTTFNSTGKVLTDVGENSLGISGVAVQPTDGKIIVSGTIGSQSPGQLVILRYLSNGQLDTTFNGTGRAVSVSGFARCVAIQPVDGKILVAGGGSVSSYTLWRFNANGTLDTTFNSNGPNPGTFVSGNYHYESRVGAPFCLSLIVRPGDGKIITGGSVYFYNGMQFLVLCSNNSDGTPDLSFNGTGRVVQSVSTGLANQIGGQFTYNDGSASQLALQPDGKILVSGVALIGSTPNTARKTAVLRYNKDGTLDSSFNGTGKVFVEVGTNSLGAKGLQIQPADGKIIVVGHEAMARLHGRPYTPPTTKKYHTVTVARVAAAKGSVSGIGGYAAGTKVTLKAKAKKGYRFAGWKEKGKLVNKKSPYSFVVKSNRALVAVFKKS